MTINDVHKIKLWTSVVIFPPSSEKLYDLKLFQQKFLINFFIYIRSRVEQSISLIKILFENRVKNERLISIRKNLFLLYFSFSKFVLDAIWLSFIKKKSKQTHCFQLVVWFLLHKYCSALQHTTSYRICSYFKKQE